MAFVVIYDACVLYPAALRDLLMRVALTGVVQARWSDRILDEAFRSVLRDRPDIDPAKLERARTLMNNALPDASVLGTDQLVTGLNLPDPNDRHVVAAAIAGKAQVIVTYNTADFPSDNLAPFGIEAKHPDDFLLDVLDLAPAAVAQALTEQAADLVSPPQGVEDVLQTLHRLGLVQAVAHFRALMHP